MIRLTDNDKRWWRFTFAKSTIDFKRYGFEYQAKHDDDEDDVYYQNFNWFMLYLGIFMLRICLPNWIKAHSYKVYPRTWDEATIKRLGRNYYWQYKERRWGIVLFATDSSHLEITYGIDQDGDGDDTHRWSYYFPWCQYRFISHTIIDPSTGGIIYSSDGKYNPNQTEAQDPYTIRQNANGAQFEIEDYDGTIVIAKTFIEKRHWKLGEKQFKWVSWFTKDIRSTSLDISWSAETGTGKGSWKGGTIGQSIEMLPNETAEQAIRRFCEKPQRSKEGNYKMRFIRVKYSIPVSSLTKGEADENS